MMNRTNQDAQIIVPVNRELKKTAEALFEKLWLNMANVINIFLREAVNQKSIPFQVSTGKQGIGGFSPEEITEMFKKAVQQTIETKQQKGVPIARYDIQSKRAYLESADGSREYV